MRNYFDAKNKKESWEVLFNYRFSSFSTYPKWLKFIMWFGYFRWKDDCQKGWEAKFKDNEQQLQKEIEEYDTIRKEMHEKTCILMEKVIPELKVFSKNIYTLHKDKYCKSLEEIAEMEGF